jgi:hypothetical protein
MTYPGQDAILTLTVTAAVAAAIALIGYYLAQQIIDWMPPALSGSP